MMHWDAIEGRLALITDNFFGISYIGLSFQLDNKSGANYFSNSQKGIKIDSKLLRK